MHFKGILLWYGKSLKLNYYKLLKREGYAFTLMQKRQSIKLNRHGRGLSAFQYFYVPSDWNLILLKQLNELNKVKICYLYSPYYYFKLIIPSNLYTNTYFTPLSNSLLVYSLVKTPTFSLYIKSIVNLFMLFTKTWFYKLKIKGKGYYIYKNFRNTVTYQFGYSHRTYLYFYTFNIKFVSKTVIIMFGVSKSDILIGASSLKSSKPINIFTGRGVRFSKQIIYKKTGKVSSYR